MTRLIEISTTLWPDLLKFQQPYDQTYSNLMTGLIEISTALRPGLIEISTALQPGLIEISTALWPDLLKFQQP